jgi:cell division protein FtsQ
MAVRKNNTERSERTALLEPEQAGGSVSHRQNPREEHSSDLPVERPEGEDFGEQVRRSERRAGVRRRKARLGFRFSPTSRWAKIALAISGVAVAGLLIFAFVQIRGLLLRNPHFLLLSKENIAVTGNRVVSVNQVRQVFTPDAGRSIFRLPLGQRRAQLQRLAWVRRATVMRLWPDHIRVNIVERTPIAFAREGSEIQLVDQDGVLLAFPERATQQYSFPILTGISSSDPLPIRAARVELYRRFADALDRGGENVSANLSEVDVSDPEDVRAVFTGGTRQPLVHFGASNFLERYRAYRDHLAAWLQQYPQLRSVDMRYGKEVVLDTGAQPGDAAGVAKSASADLSEAGAVGNAPAKGAGSSKRKPGVTHRKVPAQHSKPHRREAQPRRQRGHPVADPIMHVVSGA